MSTDHNQPDDDSPTPDTTKKVLNVDRHYTLIVVDNGEVVSAERIDKAVAYTRVLAQRKAPVVGAIGHVSGGKSTLTAALVERLKAQGIEVVEILSGTEAIVSYPYAGGIRRSSFIENPPLAYYEKQTAPWGEETTIQERILKWIST